MTDSLPDFIRDLLNGDYKIEHTHTCCPNCNEEEEIGTVAMREMHSRPLYVISSTVFNSLQEANDQLSEWFEDGTLNAYTAVYDVKNQDGSYVISASEFDTEEEANEQIVEWHNMGMLDKKARVYETSLSDTYEISIKLTNASLL